MQLQVRQCNRWLILIILLVCYFCCVPGYPKKPLQYLLSQRQIRTFDAQDIRHLLEDRQSLAEDFFKAMDTIKALLRNAAGPPALRLDHTDVMIELSRLVYELDQDTDDDAMDWAAWIASVKKCFCGTPFLIQSSPQSSLIQFMHWSLGILSWKLYNVTQFFFSPWAPLPYRLNAGSSEMCCSWPQLCACHSCVHSCMLQLYTCLKCQYLNINWFDVSTQFQLIWTDQYPSNCELSCD